MLLIFPEILGESVVPKDESDITVQESAAFARIGRVAARRELLFPIWERLLWILKQKNAEIAKSTPMTTPIDTPIIKPDDKAFISLSLFLVLAFKIYIYVCVLSKHPVHSEAIYTPVELNFYVVVLLGG